MFFSLFVEAVGDFNVCWFSVVVCLCYVSLPGSFRL